MYIPRDDFSTAEKINIRQTNEPYDILENIDLSASQYEIHRQLCLQGSNIRDKNFLWVWRTVVTSIARLFQKCDEVEVEADKEFELRDVWLKRMEESLP